MTTLHDALLERRAMHQPETWDVHDDGADGAVIGTSVMCRECIGQFWPCEQSLLLDVAIAAEAARATSSRLTEADMAAWLMAQQELTNRLYMLREHLCGGEGGA